MLYHHISLKLDLCQFFFPFWRIFWLKLIQWLQIIKREVFDVWHLKFNPICTSTLCWVNLNPHWHTSKHLMHFFHQSVITSVLTAVVTAKTLTSLPAIQSVCSSHSISFVCLSTGTGESYPALPCVWLSSPIPLRDLCCPGPPLIRSEHKHTTLQWSKAVGWQETRKPITYTRTNTHWARRLSLPCVQRSSCQ